MSLISSISSAGVPQIQARFSARPRSRRQRQMCRAAPVAPSAHLLWTIAEHPQRRGKIHMLFETWAAGPVWLGMGGRRCSTTTPARDSRPIATPSMPGIRLLELVDPAVHLLGCRPKMAPLMPCRPMKVKRPWGAADDGCQTSIGRWSGAAQSVSFAQLIPPVRDIGWQRIMLPMMRERFLMARLHKNRKLLFKRSRFRLRLQHGGAEGFDLTRMVARPMRR